MLKHATRATLVEQVAMQIQSIIETGVWPVGKKIPAEPELVRQLGVSRNTVREAARALIHIGLLEARQGDGTYVCASSDLKAAILRRLRRTTIIETLEVRSGLEREAASLAAIRRTAEDLETMRGCLERMKEAIERDDFEEYVQFDMQFHQSIVRAARNGLLTDLYSHMSEALRDSIGGTLGTISFNWSFHKSHSKLVDAISERNRQAAEEAVQTYIEEARSKLIHEQGEEQHQ